MLVYGVISPHPPIILPEIGGSETKKVQKTISALEKAAHELALAKPDKLIIISPHPQHGFQVPLYYLGQNLKPDIEIEEILVTNPSYSYYCDLGRENQGKIQNSKERVAIIASGDMSHVLKTDGPYGFNPAGPKLDKIIIDGIKNKDIDSLLNIDERVLNQGAECGLRSFLFLFGVFKSTPYKPEVLSYEGPFGVGYLVAVLRPEAEK
jgi:AmmeMemoRadiSam system protein B